MQRLAIHREGVIANSYCGRGVVKPLVMKGTSNEGLNDHSDGPGQVTKDVHLVDEIGRCELNDCAEVLSVQRLAAPHVFSRCRCIIARV